MKRILFNLKANNAHGLHSPLVYALYQHVINPTYAKKTNFETKLSDEIKSFFSITKHSQHQLYSIELPHDTNILDSIFLNSKNIMVIKNIRNQQSLRLWHALIKEKKVIFSIELFELGIIILDPIAPKQNFILKKSRLK